jgi:hypothetical protein
MKVLLSIVLSASLLASGVTAFAGSSRLPLIPQPAEILEMKGSCQLSSNWKLQSQTRNADDEFALNLLRKEIKSDYGWDLENSTEASSKTIILKEKAAQPGDPELYKTQGYCLTLGKDQIIIEAPTSTGRYYGVQSLRQLIRASKSGRLPLLSIKDYPSLEIRGISDDISRGQVSTLENFIETIERLGYFKKNMYQPYIEDMFSFTIDPNIGRERGPITKEEMAKMVEIAKQNHINLCPVFETLGHQDRLLSLPQNRKFAEVQGPGTKPWSFSPVKEESFQFVTKLIDEVAEATPNPYFHIGGDESMDIGEGTSKDMVAKIGIGKVHARYYSRIINYIKEKYHRDVMLYGDMLLKHPDAMEEMPKDAFIVDWHYYPSSEYTTVRILKDAGFKNILVSPGVWGWANFYPNYIYAFNNINVFCNTARREKCRGSITSSWGDDGSENLRENNFLLYAYSAAAEWEQTSPDLDEVCQAFIPVNYGFTSKSMALAEKKLGLVNLPTTPYPARVFHTQPKIKEYDQEWLDLMQGIKKEMQEVRTTLAKEQKKARYYASHFKAMDHAAKRFIYLADSQILFDDIAENLGDTPYAQLPKEKQLQIRKDLETLKAELLDIHSEYAGLWMQNNKANMMSYQLNRLQRELVELQSFILKSQTGNLVREPRPQGYWLWYPDENATTKSELGDVAFKRILTLKDTPILVEMKAWADDKATFAFNGSDVYTIGYFDLPKFQNLTDKLQKGDNIITIKGNNLYGAAGIIFEINVTYPDQSKETIFADSDWMCTLKPEEGWEKTTQFGPGWIKAKILGKGAIIPWEHMEW